MLTASPFFVETALTTLTICRVPMSVVPLGLICAALVILPPAAEAQALRAESIGQPSGPNVVRAPAESHETVRLLTGLAKIESDLKLGMLILKDGMKSPEGAIFTQPRAETYPEIRDGLAAVGVTDFEPLLIALEAAGDRKTAMLAYSAAIRAVMLARSDLKPSARDMLSSIIDQTRAVAGQINSAGATEVRKYHDAWAVLIVARNQIDFLVHNKDADIALAATAMALAFDDVILSMSDPNTSGPVAFDPAPVVAVIRMLEGLAETL